ncbi:MAG: RHS repeat-associated core domain-containing protein [Treponema sp.]|nr:RHS repeat-associated core domain-containing protein [Treponema sp.]
MVWREHYIYDRNGNRAGKTTPWGTITYGYDAENRLIQKGDIKLSYDKDGNLLSEEGLRRKAAYGYNGQNRMIYSEITNLVEQSRIRSRYEYDALGRRTIVEDEGGSPVRTLYDGVSFEVVRSGVIFNDGQFTTRYSSGIQWDTNRGTEGSRYRWVSEGEAGIRTRSTGEGSTTTARYVGISVILYGKGEAVGISRGASVETRGGPVYLGKDVLGSVRTTTGEYGDLEGRYEYDAFGLLYKGDLNNGMNLGYTGKPYDTTTGLYNYGYRDYQPELARFTTIDPVRDGNNWFTYVNNDPVNWRDPWGLECSASDEKKLTYRINDNGTVSLLNTSEVEVGWLGVTYYETKKATNNFGNITISAEFEMKYEDKGSGYTDFNFVQNVRSTGVIQKIDISEEDALYNTKELTEIYKSRGYVSIGAFFYDRPSRTDVTVPFQWEAETSIVGKNESGRYEILATVSWGFTYNSITQSSPMRIPVAIGDPSEFQQNAVNGLNQ